MRQYMQKDPVKTHPFGNAATHIYLLRYLIYFSMLLATSISFSHCPMNSKLFVPKLWLLTLTPHQSKKPTQSLYSWEG